MQWQKRNNAAVKCSSGKEDRDKKEEKSMNRVKVAAIQMRCAASLEENLKKAEAMVRKAAAEGANVILLPELFEREYFCQQRRYDFYHYAKPVMENDAVRMGMRLAAELGVVLPISFYERDVNNLYNSIACIDADGTVLGVYRKTHIPDDHYYQEKFYFFRQTEEQLFNYKQAAKRIANIRLT